MISVTSALMIQSRDVSVYPFQKGNLWGYMVVGNSKEAPLSIKKPIYASESDALKEGSFVVSTLKNSDLSRFFPEKKESSNLVQKTASE